VAVGDGKGVTVGKSTSGKKVSVLTGIGVALSGIHPTGVGV